MTRRSYLRSLLSVTMCMAFLPALSRADDAPATQPAKIKIVLCGDSTVTDNAGWANGFKACLSPDVQCINLSRGGRSSGSFMAEGLWKKALDLNPNYVLVQFGHNDQPGHGPARESDPNTTYRAHMQKYIDDARAAGITPILVTPMSRRQWSADGKIHSTLQPYADAVLSLAAQNHVAVIDLHARAIELYESLGKAAILKLSPRKNADPKNKNADTASAANNGYDGTHLNAAGSKIMGAIVARELAKAEPELAQYIHVPESAASQPAQ